MGPQVCHCSHFSAILFLLLRTQARPLTFYPSLLSVDDLASYYSENRSCLIWNSPLFIIITAVTPSFWSIFPSFPTISEMRDLCSCKWQCIHMQSWSHPSHFKLGWVFLVSLVSPSLLNHPCHCTNFPRNLPFYKNSPLILHNSLPTTSFSAPFYSNTSGIRYVSSPIPRPHLPFSFHPSESGCCPYSANTVPQWLLPWPLVANSSDHLFSVHLTWSLHSIWQTTSYF